MGLARILLGQLIPHVMDSLMTKALPMKLPADFIWVESQPEDDWSGARLELDGCPILQVQPCRSGWLVTVLLPDPLNPQANVAVRSVAAGMRWSARWARSRVGRLRSLVADRQRVPAPLLHSAAAALYRESVDA